MTKTCGECKHFDGRYNFCAITPDLCTVEPDYSACDGFEQKPKPTNGDKIIAGGNKGIAAFACGLLNDKREETFQRVLSFLNAPAESEGEDE